MLVDSHCHLDFADYAADRDAVLERARVAGVGHMLTICTRLRDARAIIDVANAHDHVSASIGTHPDEATAERDLGRDELLELATEPKVVAIGECGLDYHNRDSILEDQHAVFRRHIQASLETGLPLVIHTREAEDDTIRILEEELAGQTPRGVFHCFTSSRGLAEKALEMGFHISFSGIVTFKNAAELREIVGIVPVERLLVETDAPFLAPMPHRGKRNEPAYVAHTANMVATLKEIPAHELASRTTENFFSLFARAAR